MMDVSPIDQARALGSPTWWARDFSAPHPPVASQSKNALRPPSAPASLSLLTSLDGLVPITQHASLRIVCQSTRVRHSERGLPPALKGSSNQFRPSIFSGANWVTDVAIRRRWPNPIYVSDHSASSSPSFGSAREKTCEGWSYLHVLVEILALDLRYKS